MRGSNDNRGMSGGRHRSLMLRTPYLSTALTNYELYRPINLLYINKS